MIVITQQYDAYEQIAAKMNQADIQRFSEGLVFNYPGIIWPGKSVSCAGATGCYQYTLNITNAANIGTQVARIYINSTLTGCTSACILDPASSPTASRFRSADRYINPSETYHLVFFWLPSGKAISNQVLNTISVVTTRGRVFTLQFPLPAAGPSAPPASGGATLGCLAIQVDPLLVTYTSPFRTQPPIPIPGWHLPYNTYLILYVKVSNICSSPVKLLDRSGFTARRYTGAGAGSMQGFYLASLMSLNYCNLYFPNTFCVSTASGNSFPLGGGTIQPYNSTKTSYPGDTCPTTDPCYVIPASLSRGTQSLPMYILFSATAIGGNQANKFTTSSENLYIGFLAMYWQCTTSADSSCAQNYTFGVTLPFISFSTFPGP